MAIRRYHQDFEHRGAHYRICCSRFAVVTAEIVRLRAVLEDYIASRPEFQASLAPVPCENDAPEIVKRLVVAAVRTGVGPMAGVAGAFAQMACEAGLRAGASEAIIDNGGDVFAAISEPLVVGLFTGAAGSGNGLGLRLEPRDAPIAVCSSSGRMGHSTSLGSCDLATVVSQDAALADAAATRTANRVRSVDDMEATLDSTFAIDGVDGVLIAHEDKMALRGRLPELVRVR